MYNFNTHITEKIRKASKGIGVIRKPLKSLPRNALLTLYKSFIRPHLDYDGIVYDQPDMNHLTVNLNKSNIMLH